MFTSKKNYHLEDSMQSLIKTAQFQDKFEVPKLNQQDQSLQFAILDLLDISKDLDKLGSQNFSKQILKIAHDTMDDERSDMDDLPPDYEPCDTCGYDHSYDISYPGVKEEIERAHGGPDLDDYETCGTCGYDHEHDGEDPHILKEINRKHLEAGDTPSRSIQREDVGEDYYNFEDAHAADDSDKKAKSGKESKIGKEICKHLEKIEKEMEACEYAISTFDYKEDDKLSKKELDKLQKAFNKMNDDKSKMLDILDQLEERSKSKESEKSDESESNESDDLEEKE